MSSEKFSLRDSLVRVTRGARRPHLSFYRAEYSTDSWGGRRIDRLRYLGWRIARVDERTTIRNYRPAIVADSAKKKAWANYLIVVPSKDQYLRPRSIQAGPVYTGPPRPLLQKARFTVSYANNKGLTRTQRLLYRFYDKRSIERFQRLERRRKMPIPLTGDVVDFGIQPWQYRIREFKARRRGSYGGAGPD